MEDDFPETLAPDEFASAGAGGTTQETSQEDFPETLDPRAFASGTPAQDFPDTISPRDFDASPNTSTGKGAATRGAAEGALPAIGGLAAGMRTGATIGSMFTPGLGTAAGAVVGGVAAGLGAGALIAKGQDWVLDTLGLRDNGGMFSREQSATDEAQHPYARFAGGMAPAATLLRPGGSIAQRALGAGIGGVTTAATDAYQTGHVDPLKVAMGTAFGAALPSANRFGEAAAGGGGGGGNLEPPRPRAPSGLPNEPPPTDSGGGAPLNGEVLSREQQALEYQNNGKYADLIKSSMEQRDLFEPADPAWKFWNDYMEELQSRADGKGGVDVDASLGPHSEDNPFTYQMANRANDATTTSAGIAHENAPAPQIEGAGNPVGAPMEGRVAQRPNGPLRDYRKLPSPPPPEGEATQPSTVVSNALIHEDIASALAPREQPAEVGTTAHPRIDTEGLANEMRGPVEPQTPQVREGGAQAVSQVQREALDAIHQRMAGQQKGEAFQPDASEVTPPRAPGGGDLGTEPTNVTAAVTPQEQRVTDAAVKALRAAGMNEALKRLGALPPKQQAVAATKLLNALQSRSGEATGAGSPGEVRMPGKRPELPTGVTARSKGDAARKQGVLDAYDKAVAENEAPTGEEAKGALLDRLARMVKRADELAGGNTYRPNVKPPSWQLIKQARNVLSKPTPKSIEAYQQAEALLRQGATEKVTPENEVKNLDQETSRIDSDIEHKPQIEDNAAEALLNQNAADTTGRIEHEHFVNDKGEESLVYTRQHNGLTGWLNNLSDESHAALTALHPDLALDVKATQDPVVLQNELMADLSKWQRENLGPKAEFEAVPGEDAPAVKRTPIKTRDDLAATEPGAPASKGRVLDKNSAEFKELAAQYGGARPKKSAVYDLAHEEAAARGQRGDEPIKPLDGSEKSAWDHFADMMADEQGRVPMDKFFQNAADWMKQKVTDWTSPRASDPIKEYAGQLGGGFTRLSNRLTQFKGELLANARSAQFKDGTTPTPAEKGQIYRAMERGETALLPTKLHEFYKDFVKPLADKYGPMYDEFRDLADRLRVPGWDELPARVNNGNGFMDWVPRVQKGKHGWDTVGDDYDPVTGKGQSLSHWAETAQVRDWFSLQDSKGNRFTYQPGDGYITRFTNGAPSRIKVTSNSFDPREVGSTLKMKRGGKEDTWTVDHATVDEITAAAGKLGGKSTLEYHDSPVLAYTNALYGLNNGLERLRMFRDIVESKQFQDNTTRSKKVAEENGWVKTKLPQFDNTYMPQQIAWAMDDFVKRGLPIEGLGKTKLDQLATTSAKIFYFFGPAVHAMNEADKWAVGRGTNWVTPQGWRSLVSNGIDAVKSVHTQNALQREMVEAGTNPMLMHTLTRDLMGKVARATGDDIAKNASKWDPFARAFGVSTKELARRAYDASSAGMWWVSDVLATQRYLEEKQVRGLSPQEAAKSTHDFIDSYQMPTTVGGSRLAQQFLTDPSASLFGPYHYGVFHTLANMAKNLVGPNASLTDRKRAAGQWAVQAAMLFAVYPILSAGYSKLTGNEKSEVEARGTTRLTHTAKDIITGKAHDANMLRNVWTPSTLVSTGLEQISNRDWMGKEIADQPYGDVQGAASNVARRTERAAQSLVSPYGTIARAAETPGASAGSMAGKFLESNLGLKTPTPGAEKYEAQQPKRDNALMKAHRKRPTGLIEHGVNLLTE